MQYEYKLSEQDFLNFQLFTASKSENVHRKVRNNRIILSLASFAMCFLAYTKGSMGMSIYLGVTALLFFAFYPLYFKWRYKKNSTSHIQKNYSNQFGELASIEFKKTHLFLKNKTGEGKVKLSELENITETQAYYYIKLVSGNSLIIPKKEIEDVNSLEQHLKSLKVKMSQELNWRF